MELQGYIQVVVLINCSALIQVLSTLLYCRFDFSTFIQIGFQCFHASFIALESDCIYFYKYVTALIFICFQDSLDIQLYSIVFDFIVFMREVSSSNMIYI